MATQRNTWGITGEHRKQQGNQLGNWRNADNLVTILNNKLYQEILRVWQPDFFILGLPYKQPMKIQLTFFSQFLFESLFFLSCLIKNKPPSPVATINTINKTVFNHIQKSLFSYR